VSILNRFVAAILLAVAGCGDDNTPTGPGPIPIDPPPVVNNTPPVIGKFTVQGIRPNEPPNFADASEDVPVSVEVTDAESSVNDLKFNWTAPVGIFIGSGRAVTWRAPATVQAPTDLTINLEIVETYTSAGKTVENRVTGSAPVSLHDSLKEVGDMAHQFILDFSDSTIGVTQVMRNFQPGCYGTEEERGQVAANRDIFFINPPSTVVPESTTIGFGGTCPFRSKKGDACARVYAQWNSTFKVAIDGNKPGDKTVATGVDQIAAFYYPDQKRWKLCDSQFDPDSTSLRAAQIRGLVP
jgi:hypothetical protein